jgi:formate-dependent nitrite reductase membrane component NrfD
LFATSAIYNSAVAVDLALTLNDREYSYSEDVSGASLQKIKTLAKTAEAVNLGGYLLSAGESAAPVVKGKYAPHLWVGAVGAGFIIPQILNRLSSMNRDKSKKKWLKAAAGAVGLLGGLALKWAIVHGGQASADDPHVARKVTSASGEAGHAS